MIKADKFFRSSVSYLLHYRVWQTYAEPFPIMQRHLWVFTFLCLLLFQNRAMAQETYLKQYTVDDGLPSNEIYHIAQDHQNNLIVATDRGASRFDGYRFEAVLTADQNTSIPVYYIHKTTSGKILFSGTQGKLYNYQQQHLKAYPWNPALTSLYQHSGLYIANTLAEQHDTLWISYNNDFNYHLNVGSCFITPAGNVQKWIEKDGLYFDLRKNFHYRQLTDSSAGRGAAVYITWPDGSTQKDTTRLNWKSAYIRRLYHLRVDGYDLLCIGRRVLVYKNKKKVSEHLFDANVLHLTSLQPGSIMVGFENAGAQECLMENGKIQPPRQTFLPHLSVSFIYKDHQGGIWFSTQESGLFYRHPTPAYLWDNTEIIKSITEVNNGVLVGFSSGKMQRFAEGRRAETFQLPLKPGNNFIRFAFDQDSQLLYKTDQHFYKRQPGRWRLFNATDYLLLPVSEQLVFGTSSYRAELNIYSRIGGPLLQTVRLPKRVVSMHYDRQERLWLGTLEGLYLWEHQQLRSLVAQNRVFGDRIVAIREMGDGRLVVASLSNGIALIDEKEIRVYDKSNGLAVPFINALQVDGTDIWLSTNNGLTKLSLGTPKYPVRQYGLESGLPTLNIQDFTISGNWLYLKWLNKVAALPLAPFNQPLTLDQVYLHQLSINGGLVKGLPRSSLRPYQNDIEFQFTSINLAGGAKQLYTYRLLGYDREWQTTREQFAKYTNLPPGHYEFRIRALLEGGSVTTPETMYAFSIAKPFWQHWWFYGLTVGLLTLVVALFFSIRMNAVRRKNQLELDLAESQQQALVQLINPHFAFNILNTIQGTILKEDKLFSASLLAQFAKLMRLSLEMSKEKFVPLEREQAFLRKYLELEALRIPGKFQYMIQQDDNLPASQLLIPTMLVQPFVENAIKHGFMHLEKQGILQVRFYQVPGQQLFCAIDDNGVGRKVSAMINHKRGATHQSSGIEITLKRLQLLHRQHATLFHFEIIDKTNSAGQACGTTTILSLPYKKDL